MKEKAYLQSGFFRLGRSEIKDQPKYQLQTYLIIPEVNASQL